jgi:hypothetical protein
MANFTEIKTGGWDDEDPLTGDQVSSIQDTLLKAPNFAEGGTYSPTAVVRIEGEEGLSVETLAADALVAQAITAQSDPVTRGRVNGNHCGGYEKIASFPEGVATRDFEDAQFLETEEGTTVTLVLAITYAVVGDWFRVRNSGASALHISNGTTNDFDIGPDESAFAVFNGTNWMEM